MSDLLDLYKQLGANYTDTLKATQDAQANAMALDNARRAQQEREGLKALYAQQAQPSMAQLGAVNPEYAQSAMKNQLEMQQAMVGMRHQQAQTGEIETKMDREKEALMSKAALPYLNAYEANKGKIPDAENHHRLMTGLSDIANQAVAGNWAPSHYTTIDPNATFDSIVSNVNKSNVFTNSQQLQQELAKAQGSQQGLVQGGVPMTSEQKNGFVKIDELTWLPYQVPPLKVNQPTQPTGNEGAGYTNDQNAQFNVLQELLNANPNDEALRRSVIAQRQKIELQGGEQPQSEIATPQQIQTKRAEQKANEESAIKTAQIEATEKAADKKAIETYLRGPKPEAVRNLIKESIEGDVQSGLARLGKFFGVAVPGGDALAALKVIQQQMQKSLPYAPGASSDIDVRNRLEMISNPATDEPIINRLRALEEVIRDSEAYVVQKGDFLSEDQILDSIKNGYISEPSALEMLNNRMLNKGKPIYAPTQGNKTSTGVK